MTAAVPALGEDVLFSDGSYLTISHVLRGYDDGTWCVIDAKGRGWIILGRVGSGWRAVRRRVVVNPSETADIRP